jgi:SAM-dependent methyltransferase
MTFSPEWLALREPADHASLNSDVRSALARHFMHRASIQVVDLGCGAGSNLRGLADILPPAQSWTLVDYDKALLLAAYERLAAWADASEEDNGEKLIASRHGRRLTIGFKRQDLTAVNFVDLFGDADLVTAAALFDLVSVPVIETIVDAVVARRKVFMTVLSYDGHARWTPPQDLDGLMRDAFNAHQRTDKGFGPAAGPMATDALAKAFHRRGYQVLRGTSAWVLDSRFETLRKALDEGWAAAVVETGKLPQASADAWLAARRSAPDAVSVVGHEDLLAVPA